MTPVRPIAADEAVEWHMAALRGDVLEWCRRVRHA